VTELSRYTLRAIEYAVALDCRLIHLMAGRVSVKEDRTAADAMFRDNLAWAVDVTKGTGIRCVLEFLNQTDVAGFFLQNLNHAANLNNGIGTDDLWLLFDVYHCRMDQREVLQAYRELRPLIKHIQFADVPGRHEPGTGDIAWNELRILLESSGYEGWVGCEYRPQLSTVQGLKWRTEI
jgi:hydroxypyruvate isomerase